MSTVFSAHLYFKGGDLVLHVGKAGLARANFLNILSKSVVLHTGIAFEREFTGQAAQVTSVFLVGGVLADVGAGTHHLAVTSWGCVCGQDGVERDRTRSPLPAVLWLRRANEVNDYRTSGQNARRFSATPISSPHIPNLPEQELDPS